MATERSDSDLGSDSDWMPGHDEDEHDDEGVGRVALLNMSVRAGSSTNEYGADVTSSSNPYPRAKSNKTGVFQAFGSGAPSAADVANANGGDGGGQVSSGVLSPPSAGKLYGGNVPLDGGSTAQGTLGARGQSAVASSFDGRTDDLQEGRNSGDSWLSVVSEKNNNFILSGFGGESQDITEAKLPEILAMTQLKALNNRSILDCVIELLKGTRATKKKSFRRTGERWIWLGQDLLNLIWKSKKKGEDYGKLNLAKVKNMRGIDKELVLETSSGKKLDLCFNTQEELRLWVAGLSCLVPKRSSIVCDFSLPDRTHYDPCRDSFQSKLVCMRKQVNNFILLGTLGKGTYGKVKLAISKEDKRFYAIKITPRPGSRFGISSTDAVNAKECAVLRALRHPNLVRHREFLYDPVEDALLTVLEYMPRGVVMNSASLEGAKPLSEDGLRELVRDIVLGLEYLHQNRIVHRDIKPDNLLRGGDGTVRLSDLGEARMYALGDLPRNRRTEVPGTPAFMAPELCMTSSAPSIGSQELYPADVWSLGATIYYMVFGRVPFLAKSVFEMYEQICTAKLKFPSTPKVSKKLTQLLEAMLTKDPKKRASLLEVKSHGWFTDKVEQKHELPLVNYAALDLESAITQVVTRGGRDSSSQIT
ncbi:putative serine/threonine-protein kinase [Porphyridium purpureum]|uniref:Putative serine/threonine-protein kinase n=1 Tax=Porphyridium purpureum TaxID=35688 RepID=A0A5J4YUD9_PORPP|nr:putative serine/threonine-protein kinase [Porphyridium purpureum]|eukprot:POR4920..scf227_4